MDLTTHVIATQSEAIVEMLERGEAQKEKGITASAVIPLTASEYPHGDSNPGP